MTKITNIKFKSAISLIVILLVISQLTACTFPTFNNNSDYKPTGDKYILPLLDNSPKLNDKSYIKKLEKDKIKSLKWINQRMIKTKTSSGGIDYIFLGELENVGDEAVSFTDLELSVLDKNNEELKDKDINIYPSILDPGKKGYICELAVNSLIDTDIDPEDVSFIDITGEYNDLMTMNKKETKAKLSNPEFKLNRGIPSVSFSVKNIGEKKIDPLYVVFPVYSPDDVLLTVIVSELENFKTGDTLPVNQLAFIYDDKADYTNAKAEPFFYHNRLIR